MSQPDYGTTAYWEAIDRDLRRRFAPPSRPEYLERPLREACRRIAQVEDVNVRMADALRALLAEGKSATPKGTAGLASRALADHERLQAAVHARFVERIDD